jgi:hypothetical protein
MQCYSPPFFILLLKTSWPSPPSAPSHDVAMLTTALGLRSRIVRGAEIAHPSPSSLSPPSSPHTHRMAYAILLVTISRRAVGWLS